MQPLQEERPSGQTEAGQWPLSTKTMASSASPGDGKRTTSQLPLPSPASLPQIPSPSGNKGSELNTRPEVGGRKPGTCRPLATSSRLAQRRRRSVPFQSTTSGGRGWGRTRSLFNNNDGTVWPSRRTEQGGVLGGRVGTRCPGASTPPRARITQWPADQAASAEGGAGSPGHVCSKPRDRAAGRAGARDE